MHTVDTTSTPSTKESSIATTQHTPLKPNPSTRSLLHSNRSLQTSATDVMKPSSTTVFDEDATTYLEERIFPILLPGIEKLLRTVKRKDGQTEEELADPVGWLAQYLQKNNPASGGGGSVEALEAKVI
ncbi:hypothetical protein HDU67_006503 [Dinochytrium kinnereticum]|nr:hypothetical protein HDU67_006503 [Dinochytrium kinnereticum]